LIVGDDLRANANFVLIALNWVAGLVSVLSLRGLIVHWCQRRWIIELTITAFVFCHGFLVYVQSGCAYIPALSLLMLAFYQLAKRESGSIRGPIAAGLALAGSVCMWFPFVLALPAAVVAPLFFHGWNKAILKKSVLTAVLTGLFIGLTYLIIMIGPLGIRNPAGLRAWMSQTVGGPAEGNQLQRTVFGFARSVIYLGNDGILYKRYLHKDPYNPVSLSDVLGLSVWKIVLFYLFLGSVLLNLYFENKRLLLLFLVNSVPIVGLGLFWHGGAIERYLALYPTIFLALAVSLDGQRARVFLKYITLAFVVVMVVNNLIGMWKPSVISAQEKTANRATSLFPVLRPNSRVFTVTFTDDLFNFNRSFPFHPQNRNPYTPYAVIALGSTQVPIWRQDFASKVEDTWNRNGDVWITRRVLSAKPHSDWNWVEGDDENVAWNDIYSFFTQLEMGQSVGGEDGFMLLTPSEKNRAFLKQFPLGKKP
jgi:hypothetical protein